MKKFLKYTALLIGGVVLFAISYALIMYPPILAGMASKTMCSCMYVMGRTPESVVEKELSVFPGLNKAKFEMADSSVSATFLWKTRKSIFRKGLGCTLLAERSEEEVRKQMLRLPEMSLDTQEELPWPMGDQTSDSLIAGVDYKKMQTIIQECFTETNPEKPKNTFAVLVLYDGKIIGEQYAEGFNQNSKLMGWSMTKSLTNGLIGILVKDGKLTPDAPAPVSEWQNDDRKNITLNDLLHASSGLEWNEDYFAPGDFHTMFMDRDDKGGYAASRPLKFKIGEHFQYSSGTTNLLSKIIRQTVGDTQYPRFAYERLFHKIGMHHTLIEPDASGTFVGSSYGYASARDWGRFGLLFMNDGIWNGERILPEGWVKYSSTPAPSAPIGEYGAQFWLNAGAKDNIEKSYHPGMPHDEYGAEGFEQQFIYIIPSKKLVIVRLGVSHHGFADTELVQSVIQAIPQ